MNPGIHTAYMHPSDTAQPKHLAVKQNRLTFITQASGSEKGWHEKKHTMQHMVNK